MKERAPNDSAPRRRKHHHAALAYLSPVVKFVAFSCLLWGSGYGLAHYLRESPNYRIQHILVQGASILSPDAIVQFRKFPRPTTSFSWIPGRSPTAYRRCPA